MNDIKDFRHLTRLIAVFQRLKQLSWTVDQTGKRYPYPEAMTKEEIAQLTRAYIALGFDLEDLNKDWKKVYKEYKNENN